MSSGHREAVDAPGDEQFELLVGPAQHLTGWRHGPWRWWASVTRDRTWWVTLRRWSVGGISVVRERWTDEASAMQRALQLKELVRRGEAPTRVAWRRRRQ